MKRCEIMYKYYKLTEVKEAYLTAAEVCEKWQLYTVTSFKSMSRMEQPIHLIGELLRNTELKEGKSPAFTLDGHENTTRVFDPQTIRMAFSVIGGITPDERGIHYHKVSKRNYRFIYGENHTAIMKKLFPHGFEEDGSLITYRNVRRLEERRQELKWMVSV